MNPFKKKDEAPETPQSVRIASELERYRASIGEHHDALATLAGQIDAAEKEAAGAEVDAVLGGRDADAAVAAHQATIAALKAQHAERETQRRRAVIVSHDLRARHEAALREELEDERRRLSVEYERLSNEAEALLRRAATLLDARDAADAKEDEIRRRAILQKPGGSPAPSVVAPRWLPDLSSLDELLSQASAGRIS